MRRAIISDIHSNIEALSEVFKHIKSQGIKEVICLGDVVGYGPNPRECLDLVAEECEIVLMGNHEEAVLSGAFGFHEAAKRAVDWTRNQLKPGTFSSSRKRGHWERLHRMPLTYRERDVLFVHGSPRDPTMEYILRVDAEDLFGEVPDKIREIFSMFQGCCFVGHTHYPGIITEESKFFTPDDLEGHFHVKPGKKYIVNIGSVGQPRDRNNKASYVTYDGSEIIWHRVEYDFKKTMKKIEEIEMLDNRNAERLELGI
jgi:diadenosine tetraphosphatase ApaH/serine/threonine PP2A family protein phosphatase